MKSNFERATQLDTVTGLGKALPCKCSSHLSTTATESLVDHDLFDRFIPATGLLLVAS
jgi:hypothetical protein